MSSVEDLSGLPDEREKCVLCLQTFGDPDEERQSSVPGIPSSSLSRVALEQLVSSNEFGIPSP